MGYATLIPVVQVQYKYSVRACVCVCVCVCVLLNLQVGVETAIVLESTPAGRKSLLAGHHPRKLGASCAGRMSAAMHIDCIPVQRPVKTRMICLVSSKTGLERLSFFEKKKSVIAMNFGSLSHNSFLQPIHILYNNLHAMYIAIIPLPPKKLGHYDNFTTLKVLFW